VLDLPDFDYGYSSVKGRKSREARSGGIDEHIGATAWLAEHIAKESPTRKVWRFPRDEHRCGCMIS